MRDPGRILLLSCYELGHQPLALALLAAFLERAGFHPALRDLSVAPLDRADVERAALIAISVPMHTALRIGAGVGRRVKAQNPRCHLAYFGHYAFLHAGSLRRECGADSVFGGECEAALVTLAEQLARTGSASAAPARTGSASAAPARTGPASAPAPLLAAPPLAVAPHLARLDFPVPSRGGLPGLRHYTHLERDGERVPAGYVEASRGCLHHCRHCPLPPVYGGRFFVVPAAVVLADIAALVAAGAGHITFGDPDFLNGPGHVLRVVRAMHERFPHVTFDVTTKVSHIVKHRTLFVELAALGCAFVVSAVESLSDRVLAILRKGHTRADVTTALRVLRAARIPLRPTFVAFTPWTTADDYGEILAFVAREGLIDHVDPVQYALRLLVPPGSHLLARPELAPYLGDLDPAAATYRWTHPDPRLDALAAEVALLVATAARRQDDALATFAAISALVHERLGDRSGAAPAFPAARERVRPPRLTEDWFC